MITAKEELQNIVDRLTEIQAEEVIAAIENHCPALVGLTGFPVVRGDGQTVRVTIPKEN
ncbi:MAG: hypothetical protein KGJ13_10580 [Patescibacteria group bacterium]|nr:hypothetical protein [Patescibacteria group bacterium]